MQYQQSPTTQPRTQPSGPQNTPVSTSPAPSLLPEAPRIIAHPSASKTYDRSLEAAAENQIPLETVPPITAAYRTIFSPAVLSGAGSSLIVVAMQPYTAAVMMTATILTLCTEFRHQSQSTGVSSFSLHGERVYDAALRRLNSRGFCLEFEALAHGLSAAVSALQGSFIKACSFCMYAAGCGSVASLSNDTPTIGDHALERITRRAWEFVPSPVKRYLADPAALFAMGNVAIFANSITTSNIIEPSSLGVDLSTLSLLGLGLQVLSASWGLRHFIVPSGQSRFATSLLNGSGNFCIATGLLYSSIATPSLSVICAGSAALVWGIANFRLAWGQTPTRD